MRPMLPTSSGMCLPGMAATPVMKSDVMNGLSTTDRWHEGVCCRGSRLKWMGMRITGIWPMMLWYSGTRKVYDIELFICAGSQRSKVILCNGQIIFSGQKLGNDINFTCSLFISITKWKANPFAKTKVSKSKISKSFRKPT